MILRALASPRWLSCLLGLTATTPLLSESIELERWKGLLSVEAGRPESPGSIPFTLAPALRRISPAVVTIVGLSRGERPDDRNAPQTGKLERVISSLGSGILLTPVGHLVTNAHTIREAEQVLVRLVKPAIELKAEVLGRDDIMDVALLKIQTDAALPTAILGDSDTVETGDVVLAIGSPYGLEQSISMGIISGTGRFASIESTARVTEYLQTDAAIHPGNSGGPLADALGRVIGVNTANHPGTWYSESRIGLALPINLVMQVVEDLATKGYVERGFSGLRLRPLAAADTLRLFGRTSPMPAQVIGLHPASAAENAGIKMDDIVVSLQGQEMPTGDRLQFALSCAKPGQVFELEVLRAGERLPIKLTVGPARPPAPTPFTSKEQVEHEQLLAKLGPTENGKWSWPGGLILSEVDKDTRSTLGVPDPVKGALIVEAPLRDEAIKAKLHPGAIIVAVNGKETKDLLAVRAALQPLPVNKAVMLRVWKEGSLSFVAIPVPNPE
jgi:S1-C subfamily serine protease